MSNARFFATLRGFVLVLALLVILFPLYWMVVTALKPTADVFRSPPTLIPTHVTLQAFLALFADQPFAAYFVNSLVVATGTTVLSLSLGSLAAYGLTRFEVRIEPLIIFALLFIKMLPETLLIVPFYGFVADLHLLNSYLALILVYTSFALPFAVWMLIGFFRVIPRELDEAGMIDGANRLQIFRTIVLPLARPGLVAVAMMTFLTAWNTYLWALVLTTTPNMYVLPVGIASLRGEYQVQWNQLMAASVIAVIPVLAIYAMLEKYLVAGITAGAVKG